jgi:hypothetical protein
MVSLTTPQRSTAAASDLCEGTILTRAHQYYHVIFDHPQFPSSLLPTKWERRESAEAEIQVKSPTARLRDGGLMAALTMADIALGPRRVVDVEELTGAEGHLDYGAGSLEGLSGAQIRAQLPEVPTVSDLAQWANNLWPRQRT